MQPKIFYTNSSTEYWGGGRAAALTHTTLDGKRDAEVPDNVRIYLFSGTQHLPSDYPAGRNGAQQASNPNDYSWGLRALLPAMERWVRGGTAPPPSSHPRLADHTLVPIKDLDFPTIPGVQSPLSIPGGYRNDLDGPDGPAIHALPFLVPQVDGDGNELGGIAFPDVAVPLATYTGWNFRHPAIGQPGEILPLTGSYIPLPLTRAERETPTIRVSRSRSAMEAAAGTRRSSPTGRSSLLSKAICCATTSMPWWQMRSRGSTT